MDSVEAVVRAHDRPGLGLFHGDLEGLEIDFPQRSFAHSGIVVKAVFLAVVGAEVLHLHAAVALCLNALYEGGGQGAGQIRIFGVILEIAAAEGIAVDVEARSQPDGDAGFLHFLADGAADLVEKVGVPGAGQERFHGPGGLGRVEAQARRSVGGVQRFHLAVRHAAHAARGADSAALSAGKGRQFLNREGVYESLDLVGIGDHCLEGHFPALGKLLERRPFGGLNFLRGVQGDAVDVGVVVRAQVFDPQDVVSRGGMEAQGFRGNFFAFRGNNDVLVFAKVQGSGKLGAGVHRQPEVVRIAVVVVDEIFDPLAFGQDQSRWFLREVQSVAGPGVPASFPEAEGRHDLAVVLDEAQRFLILHGALVGQVVGAVGLQDVLQEDGRRELGQILALQDLVTGAAVGSHNAGFPGVLDGIAHVEVVGALGHHVAAPGFFPESLHLFQGEGNGEGVAFVRLEQFRFTIGRQLHGRGAVLSLGAGEIDLDDFPAGDPAHVPDGAFHAELVVLDPGRQGLVDELGVGKAVAEGIADLQVLGIESLEVAVANVNVFLVIRVFAGFPEAGGGRKVAVVFGHGVGQFAAGREIAAGDVPEGVAAFHAGLPGQDEGVYGIAVHEGKVDEGAAVYHQHDLLEAGLGGLVYEFLLLVRQVVVAFAELPRAVLAAVAGDEDEGGGIILGGLL